MNVESLEAGLPASDFKMTANTSQEIGLADFKGKAHVVLFFV